jgi:cell division protein FtsB
MTTGHRTSSIQRPITGEVTRPTRRRRRAAADGTPGRGLPERPLPGRPGTVQRAPTMAAARPGFRRAAERTTSAPSPRSTGTTAGRVTSPASGRPPQATTARTTPAARRSGPPTAAMPRTEPLARTSSSERRADPRRRGPARPPAGPRPAREPRPLSVVGEQPAARPPRSTEAPAAADATRRGRSKRSSRRARPEAVEPAASTGRTSRRARSDGARTDSTRTTDGVRPSALRDVTRPIARDSRMSERRPVRIGYGLIAAAIGLALVAALVVLPVRRWWNQRADLADRKSELDILRQANAKLGDKVAALNTPEGIEAEARTALNYGYPGEERTRSVGDPQAPIALPAGFPYSLVNAILGARVNLAAAPAGPTGSVAADPAASGAPTDGAATPTTAAPEPTIAPPPGNPLSPAP